MGIANVGVDVVIRTGSAGAVRGGREARSVMERRVVDQVEVGRKEFFSLGR